MGEMHPAVRLWFDCWNSGNVDELPITNGFRHTSPFGTIQPKSKYMEVVQKNSAEFLNNTLTVVRYIQQADQVCVQFEQKNHHTGLEMDVCEWYTLEEDLICEIQSFYNVGDAEING